MRRHWDMTRRQLRDLWPLLLCRPGTRDNTIVNVATDN